MNWHTYSELGIPLIHSMLAILQAGCGDTEKVEIL